MQGDSLASKLIDSETGLFQWWSRSDRLDLYQTGLGRPLLASTIDGFGVPANWRQAQGASKSETIFRALRSISSTLNAFYIKHYDEAYVDLDRAHAIEPAHVSTRLLDEFSSNPADQNGSSFLGLFGDKPESLVLFTYAPGEHFRISLLGTMKIAVPDALSRVGTA